jgi:hypothetical protein
MTRKQTRTNTVAIVGSHPKTRSDFDFDRTDCDVWLFNEALADPSGWAKRADAIFQMHAPEIWRNPKNRNDPGHYEWLKSGNTPTIWMRECYKDVPKAVRYPLEEIQAELLGNFSTDRFFTSSISYAIALAIYLDYDRIEMYGVELESNTEYFYQRDCATFWTGLAVGRGIDVHAPVAMFDAPYLYGYEGGANLDKMIYIARDDEVTPIRSKLEARYMDARRELTDALNIWDGSADDGDKLTAAIVGVCNLANDFGQADGVVSEARRYHEKCMTMEAMTDAYLIVRQEYEQAAAGHKRLSAERTNETLGVAAQMEEVANNIIKEIDKAKRAEAIKKFRALVGKYIEGFAAIGYHNAIVNENMSYIAQLDDITRAAGGAKSEAALTEQIKEQVQNVATI